MLTHPQQMWRAVSGVVNSSGKKVSGILESECAHWTSFVNHTVLNSCCVCVPVSSLYDPLLSSVCQSSFKID